MSNPIESKLVIQILTKDSDGNPAWADLMSHSYTLTDIRSAYNNYNQLTANAPVNTYRLVNIKVDLLATNEETAK